MQEESLGKQGRKTIKGMSNETIIKPVTNYDLPPVLFHSGPYSQWSKSHKPFTISGKSYVCCEQYMMAQKAKLFEDYEIMKQIMSTNNCKEQKQLGRRVKNFDQKIWEENCDEIVYQGNLAKFSQNDELKQMLLATGNQLIAEAAPNDTIWGIGLHENDPDALDPRLWEGQNRLGNAIMRVREELKELDSLSKILNKQF